MPGTGETIRRDLRSWTAQAERRLLVDLARRVPAAFGPDHLTALGLAAMLAAGAAYALCAESSWWLLAVNGALALNWLGDSLDGTLARVRGRQRPRYGFYLDHLVDACGAVALLVGLAFSGHVRPGLALALLVGYLLLSVHIALATAATGVFRMSYGGLGGTELRLLLGALNGAAFLRPALRVGAWRVGTLELALTLALAGLLGLLAREAWRTAAALDRVERAAWLELPLAEERG